MSHREFSIMGLDQVYGQYNKLMERCGGPSDLIKKVKDSALIHWKTCSPEFVSVILEFEDCLDQNEILA